MDALDAALTALDTRLPLAALEAEWRELEARAGASFFVSWTWIGPWLEIAAPVAALQLFRARRGATTVALGVVVPWTYRRGGLLPTRALVLNEVPGHEHEMFIEYNDLLCEPAVLDEVWPAFIEALVRSPLRWSELSLRGLPAESGARALAAAKGMYADVVQQRKPWAASIEGIAGLEQVLARFSRNRRWQTNRAIKQYVLEHGAVTAREATDIDDALVAFEQMGTLHTARWQRDGLEGSFANPNWVEFQRAVIRTGLPRGEVQLLRVRAGEVLIGVVYSFLWRGHVYMLQTGFAPSENSNERPGYVAHSLAMAFNGARGMRTYDFMCGDSEYKRSMASARTGLYWIALRRDTALNKFEDSAIRAWRGLRTRPRAGPGAVPVIVLGEGVTALGVVRAFGRRGIPVYGTALKDQALRRSRWYRALPGLGQGLATGPESLAETLRRSGIERAVLCACTDHFCSAVAALPPDLAQRFPSCMPGADTLAVLNDKGRFAELLERIGVEHPFTLLVRTPEDLARPADDEARALFLKPRDSQSFFARFGVKGFRVSSVQDARERLAAIARHDLEMVLQEYVPGPADNHYFIDGYRDRNGVVRALFARRRLRIFPPDFGNSTAMVSVPLLEVAQAANGLERLLEETGYRGIFSAEFKRDQRDGVYRILEINTRPWWYIDFAVRCGADVCTLMYQDALAEPLKTVAGYRIGARCVYPYYDIHALRHARAAGQRHSWLRWMRELLGASQPMFAWDDPLPALLATMKTLGWMRP